MKIKIEVVDPIECKVRKSHAIFLIPCLSYKAAFWRQGQHKKVRTEYKKHLFSHKTKDYWYFYTGFLNKVKGFCKRKGIEVEVTEKYIHEFFSLGKPNVPGFTLRDDQKEIIDKALKTQRGIIKEPTGWGKTIIQMGIMSAIKGNCLLLAHTSSIVNQTVEKIRDVGWDCLQIGGGAGYDAIFRSDKIVVATIQTLAKVPVDDYNTMFNAVLVDEAHRVSKFTGQYAKILSNIFAPIRLGFTATLPTEKEAKLAMKGFFGNVISQHTINDGIEKGILATPKIKLIKSRFRQSIRDQKKYADVYQKGIVNNLSRNRQVRDVVLKHSKKGETTLIFVNKIEHGKNLVILFQDEGITVPFVRGNMPEDKRKIIKTSLINKKRKIVIATTAWKEGVDIPSLDVVFNAGGGKSEIVVYQPIGRGLRRTSEKDTVIIYDFFDPSSPFLIEHFGHRISLYFDNNWL